MKEYKTKTPGSGPHGLTADKDGNIWFTGNFKAYVGKLNPKTGEVSEYPTNDPAARDPHTPIFDQKGVLWFQGRTQDPLISRRIYDRSVSFGRTDGHAARS